MLKEEVARWPIREVELRLRSPPTIAQYVEGMNPQLYLLLSQGRTEYLLDHVNFEKDMREAQEKLEGMM